MRREQVPPLRKGGTFVLPQWKLVYVATPKAACTSVKWLLADLQSVEPETFFASLSAETSRAATIHAKRLAWIDTPCLHDLDDGRLAEITHENGWFLFTVTRHPAPRLWSAWQSKFLLREPDYCTRFSDAAWLPRLPGSTDDVVEDWEHFVREIDVDPQLAVMTDPHFAPQTQLLNVGTTAYDGVYDTSEFPTMLEDLRRHLAAQGWVGELANTRSNETPLPPIGRAFPDHVLNTIGKVYASDFDLLGYDDLRPPGLRGDDYAADLLKAAAIIAERGERIGDLSRAARELNQSLQKLRRAKTSAAPK